MAIRNNLEAMVWVPCDPDQPNSKDALTLTYTDGVVRLSGEVAADVFVQLIRRSRCRPLAIALIPDLQREIAA